MTGGGPFILGGSFCVSQLGQKPLGAVENRSVESENDPFSRQMISLVAE
jgi:hypothetical protein